MRGLRRFPHVFIFISLDVCHSNVKNSDYTHRPTYHVHLCMHQQLLTCQKGRYQTHSSASVYSKKPKPTSLGQSYQVLHPSLSSSAGGESSISASYLRGCVGKGASLALAFPTLSCFPTWIQAARGMLEHIGEYTVLVQEEYAGSVVQKLTLHKGEMVSYDTDEDGWVKVVMEVPARGLIGYMAGKFKKNVHGQG